MNTTIHMIEQKLSPGSKRRLVPTGLPKGPGDVDEIIYYYKVEMKKNHTLDVTLQNVRFLKDGETSEDVYGLLGYDYDIRYDDSTASVELRVRLRKPSTEEEYRLMQNAQATFNVSFQQIPLA